MIANMYEYKHCTNNAYFKSTAYSDANKGMRIQGDTILNPGFKLFKFIQRCDVPVRDVIKSPWWFQAKAVRNILDDARRGRGDTFSPIEQAKQNAGLSRTWSKSGAKYIVSVNVFNPVRVLWGDPRVIGLVEHSKIATGLQENDKVVDIEIIPDSSCTQFYIPGFYDYQVVRKSISIIDRTSLHNNEDILNGDIESFIRSISK